MKKKLIIIIIISTIIIGSSSFYYIWLKNQEQNEIKEKNRVLLFHVGFNIDYSFTLRIESNTTYDYSVYAFAFGGGGMVSGNRTENHNLNSIRVDLYITNPGYANVSIEFNGKIMDSGYSDQENDIIKVTIENQYLILWNLLYLPEVFNSPDLLDFIVVWYDTNFYSPDIPI